MHFSKQMILGWLEFLQGFLAVPQLVALIPEPSLPWFLAATAIVSLLFRWLGGGLGVNPLTGVGVVTIIASALGVPEIGAVLHLAIPPAWMPTIAMISGVLTLLARYLAGRSSTDPALPVNFLLRTTTT